MFGLLAVPLFRNQKLYVVLLSFYIKMMKRKDDVLRPAI